MKLDISGLNIPQAGQIFNLFFEITDSTNLVNNGTIVRFLSGTLQNKIYLDNLETTNPTFFPNEVLPDIKQIDFIKDWAMIFGLVFDVGTTDYPGDTIICKNFNEIIAQTDNTVDWSSKRDLKVRQTVKYNFDGYTQSNRFKWADNKDFKVLDFGEIRIPNENLDPVQDYYVSLFQPTPEVEFTNGNGEKIVAMEMGQIPGTSWTYVDDITDMGYRLGYVEDNTYVNTSGGATGFRTRCRYNGNLESDYDIAKFTNLLAWNKFLNAYYSKLIKALQAVKIVTGRYALTPEDITRASSPFVIVRVENRNYLCMSIDRFIKDTKCDSTLFLLA